MTKPILISIVPALLAMLASPAHAYVCGDLNGNLDISAADALAALRVSVGQNVSIDCGSQQRTLATNQITCFNAAGNTIDCAGTGHDGELQKGAPRAYVDNGDGTVTDRGTGLQWEQFDDGGGVHAQDNQLSWLGAFVKIAQLNAASFAGHSDWRLPNISELATIGNFGRVDPGTFVPYFHHDCTTGCEIPDCACIPSPNYEWSSTTYEPQADYAWALQMRFGEPIRQAKFLGTYTARAVRGGFSASDISNEPAFEDSCADVNASDSILSSDALAILRKSVELPVDLVCILRSPTLATGQTACFSDVGVEVPCVGTGQDGDLERGLARSFTNNGNGTVTDQTTGLVWEILSADSSIHDLNNQYTWEATFEDKISALNDASFAGHADWRVPNFFEVKSLINYGSPTSAVYDAFFNSDCAEGCTNTQCSCLPGKNLWSSTTMMADKMSAIDTSLTTGLVTWKLKTDLFTVRGVRGGE